MKKELSEEEEIKRALKRVLGAHARNQKDGSVRVAWANTSSSHLDVDLVFGFSGGELSSVTLKRQGVT